MYQIKPLKFIGGKNPQGDSRYSAGTPFGSYEVSRNVWFCSDCINSNNYKGCDGDVEGSITQCGEFETWKWGYCFDEYYDEDQFECKTLKEGRQKASEHWLDRIRPIFKEVT